MKISTFILLTLLFWLQVKLIFGNHGLRDYIKLYHEISNKETSFFYVTSKNFR